MRYKVLVTGNNDSAITAFFEQMDSDFVVLSTSTRYDDILGHIDYFEPNIFVYCLQEEARDRIAQMMNINSRLMQFGIPCVIFGTKEACDNFNRIAVDVASLVLHRPLSPLAIQEKILEFMKGWHSPNAMGNLGAAGNFGSIGNLGNLGDTGVMLEQFSDPAASDAFHDPYSADGLQFVSHKKHILIVDDNVMMLKVIKEHLHEKYDVATAVSGKMALKFLERKTTDLILLDYEMPQENGPAVLAKLRASNATKHIPVIFLTGVTESKKIKEALVLKPQGYLLKPIDYDKLMEEITRVIG